MPVAWNCCTEEEAAADERGGCTCPCHYTAGMQHRFPCCDVSWSGRRRPTVAESEKFREMTGGGGSL